MVFKMKTSRDVKSGSRYGGKRGTFGKSFLKTLTFGEREISLIWGERGGLWEPVLKGILWEMKGIALIKWVF